MDKIAATIRSQHDGLIEAYNQRLQAISGAALPNQIGDELVSTLLHHLADTPEAGDDTEFAQRWVADALAEGIAPATLQMNLTALEQALMPLATTLETATFLWQIFAQTRTEVTVQTAKQPSVSTDERLDEVLNIAQAAYWEFDIATQTFTFNDQLYNLFHTSAAQEGGYQMPVQTFAGKFVYPEDIPFVAAAFQGVIETTDPHFLYERNFRVIRTSGEQRVHLVRFRAKKDEQAQIVKIVGATQDITEQKRAEQQLRENEARLAEATAIAKLYYWEFDLATQILTFSPEYYKFLGIEDDGIYKMPAQKYVEKYVLSGHADVSEQAFSVALTSPEADYFHEFENFIVTADGRVVPMLVRFRLIKDEQGNPIRMMGANQNITERKQAEEELREAHEQIQAILDAVTVPMIISRVPDGTIIYANDPHSRFFSIPRDELIGRPTTDFFENPADREKIVSLLRSQGFVNDYEVQVRKSNGELFWVLVSSRLFNFRGETATITILTDITKRKEAEEETRKLAALIENSSDFISLATLEGQIIYLNEAGRKQVGLDTSETVVGTTIMDYIPKRDWAVAQSSIFPAIMEQGRWEGETRFRHFKTEADIDMYLNTFLVRDLDSGDPISVAAVARDITERKQAEAELQKQVQRTQEALEELRRSEEVLRQNEALLSQAMSVAKLYEWELDLATQTFTFSPEYYKLLNIPITEETDFKLSVEEYAQKYVPPESTAIVTQEMEKALASTKGDYSREFEHFNVTTDGRDIPIMVRFRVIRDEAGNPIKLVGANQDITEQKRAEQQLRENEARLAEATAITKLYYWEIDFATREIAVSPEYYKFLGIKDDGIYRMPVDKYAKTYVHPDYAPLVGQVIRDGLISREKDPYRELESRLITTDGREVPILVRLRVIRDEQGNPIKALGANQDITEQKRIQEILAKQADDLQKVAEISTRIATTHNEAQLLQEVADLTKDRIGLYHAHLYLLDEGGETLILTAGAGEIGQAMVAEGRMIPFNHPRSIVALTARTGEGTIVNNVRENPDFLPHPLLPKTRSEMAVPMIVGDRLLGVFDVQADVVDRFTEEDRQILTTLAAQVAVALENARLLAQVERALADVKIVQQQYIQQAWGQAGRTQKRSYRYERSGLAPLAEEIRQKAKDLARQKKEPMLITLDSEMKGTGQQSVVAPVRLSGATIGSLQLHLAGGQNEGQALDEDDLALLEVILEQVAQSAENFRLFEETQQHASRETTIREVTTRLRSAPNLEKLLEIATEELSQYLAATHAKLEMGITNKPSQMTGNGEIATVDG